MSNNSDVTIKVDSRVLYGVIALVAVIGIFGIGWWLGNEISGGDEQQAANVAAPAADSGAAPAAAPVLDTSAGGAAAVDPNTGAAAPANPAVDMSTTARATKPLSPDEAPVDAGAPRLWVDEVGDTNFVWDFGEIPADQAVEKDFVIQNLGEGELVIEDVSASCGCTAAVVADSNLGAGEETTVRVSYDPRHNQEFGKFVTKQVRIKSNDPLVPLAEFTIQADVAAE